MPSINDKTTDSLFQYLGHASRDATNAITDELAQVRGALESRDLKAAHAAMGRAVDGMVNMARTVSHAVEATGTRVHDGAFEPWKSPDPEKRVEMLQNDLGTEPAGR